MRWTNNGKGAKHLPVQCISVPFIMDRIPSICVPPLIQICLSSLCSGICWATKARFRGSVWPCMLMKMFFSPLDLARRVPSSAQRELANTTSAAAKQAEVETSQCQVLTPKRCKQTYGTFYMKISLWVSSLKTFHNFWNKRKEKVAKCKVFLWRKNIVSQDFVAFNYSF